MPAKWRISAAFILSLAAVTLGDEPQPATSSSTSATPSRASSTAELVRQVAEQLGAANKLEESSPGKGPKETARIRSAEEVKELSVQIAEVQKQLDRLRELTGRPGQIEFRFRVLEIPAKLAAELSTLGTELLTGPSPARSLYKDTAELNERIRMADGVKTICDTSIVAPAGRPATFHTGGEFPIPVPQNGDNTTIEWRKFGNRCELVASHLDANRLRVKFQAESSQRNLENAVVIAGFTVPSLTTRRVNTQVELNLGETIVVALQATNPGTPKAKADLASQPGEPPVTLFTLTPSPVEKR
jgi:pilus assembly protein CpaC